jgi:hypothetical protein
LKTPSQRPAPESVARFRLPVGKKAVVPSSCEFEIVEIEITGKRRRHDDDARRAIAVEVIEQSARQPVVAEHVGGKCQLDAVRAHTPLALYRPGVVHQDVERSVTRSVCGHECLNGRLTRYVDLKNVHMTRARPRRDFARQRLSFYRVTAGEHQMRPERAQIDRDLSADPRGRPGDQHLLPGDPVHKVTLGFWLLA